MGRAVVLLALAGCSFEPRLIALDGGDPGPLDASDVDGKPDAAELDAPPADLDAPDGAAPPDAACTRPIGACEVFESLGSISGDTGGETLTRSGNGDVWFLLTVEEDSGDRRSPRARLRLDMPADVDFDLHAICGDCETSVTAASENGIGVTVDELTVGNGDGGNGSAGNDGFEVLVHVVHYGGAGCGDWTLTITGNVTDAYHDCD